MAISDASSSTSRNPKKRKRIESKAGVNPNREGPNHHRSSRSFKLDPRIQESRRNLPIWSGREAIIRAVRENDTVVVLGETGSGKTTQIPQFLYEAGLAPGKSQIGVTQPRRVAATSLARRVATELGCPSILPSSNQSKVKAAEVNGKEKGKGAGNLVGYSIRFDDRSGYDTKIKFMTDGWLLREMVAGGNVHHAHHDDTTTKKLRSAESIPATPRSDSSSSNKISSTSLIPQYSILIVDEAHERTIRTDLILGLAKRIQQERKTKRKEWILKGREKGKEIHELKIIVMSATLDAKTFADYFARDERTSWTKTQKQSKQNKSENPKTRERLLHQQDSDDEEDDEEDFITPKSKKPRKDSKLDLELERGNGDGNGTSSSIPILYVKGRQHSVTLNHTLEPVDDFPLAALKTILQIHTSKPEGDILVFMTGQEDIENLCESLRLYQLDLKAYGKKVRRETKGLTGVSERNSSHHNQDQDHDQGKDRDSEEREKEKTQGEEKELFSSMMILPLYASLGPNATNKIFSPTPSGTRKIVIATNIAETSITIPGIKYVIDCGYSKEKSFDSNSNIESLRLTPISQSNAIQRSGRAGRESSGECYRLYPIKVYNQLNRSVIPEILRNNLESEVLDLFAMGLDPVHFDWLDNPGRENLNNTLISLAQLGAIENVNAGVKADSDSNSNRIELKITSLGRQMSSLPISPTSARTLLESRKYGPSISRMVRDLVSILSSEKSTLFAEPNFNSNNDSKMEEFQKVKKSFASNTGDHGTFLNAFYAYLRFQKEKEREMEVRIKKLEENEKKENGHMDGKGKNENKDQDKGQKLIEKQRSIDMKEELSNWCRRNYLNERTLKEIMDIRKQLIEICEGNGIHCDDEPRSWKRRDSKAHGKGRGNKTENDSDSDSDSDSEVGALEGSPDQDQDDESSEESNQDSDEIKESSSKGLSVTRGGGRSNAINTDNDPRDPSGLGKEETYEQVRKCLLVGRKNKIGMRQSDGSYRVIHGKEVSLFWLLEHLMNKQRTYSDNE